MNHHMTIEDRMEFQWEIADKALNDAGNIQFFNSFYWGLHWRKRITHEALNSSEEKLYNLIRQSKYVKGDC